MIEIQNERGQYLNLYPDSTLENELNSWLLSEDDSLLGSYSLPFKFPVVSNESFISHKHRVEAGGFSGISVTVAVDGLPMGAGSLTFRVNNQEADGILKFDAGDVAVKLRSKFLHDAVINESFTICGTYADLPDAMFRTVDPLTNPWPFVFFPVYNEDFNDSSAELTGYSHQNYVNNWRTWPVSAFYPDNLSSIGRPTVPFFYLTWTIKKLCSYLGYTAEGAWLDLPEIKALVMYNEVAMDTSGFWGSFTANAKWHVWQMKINDFFKLLRDDMGVGVYFDAVRGVINFHVFTDQLSAPEAYDLSADLLIGKNIDPVDQSGVTIKFARDTGDAYEKELPQLNDYTIGIGEKDVTLRLGTLPMTVRRQTSIFTQALAGLADIGTRWMVPIAKRRGITLDATYKKLGNYSINFPPETIPPKLLAYYGLQKDAANKLYPFGSSLSRNVKQEECGPMSLQPDEPNSLFHRYVRPYHEFRSFSKKITLRFFLKLGVLSRLRLWEKVGVGSADMVHLTYLISKLTYQLPGFDGRALAEAVLYPILPPSADYIPLIPSGNVWVRIAFVPFDATGLTPTSVGTFIVKFQVYTTKEAVLVALPPLPLTLFYTYKTRGYDDLTGASVEKESFASIVIPAGQFETQIDTPQAFWKFDDPNQQSAFPDEYYIVRSSFIMLPGAGYRIIY